MTPIRWIGACGIASLLIASGAPAATIDYSFDGGATLQFGAGPIETLTGGLTIECPTPTCTSFGEVDFEIISIDLQSLSFSESESGPFEFVSLPGGAGFAFSRELILVNAGSISHDPNKDASLHYGFDAVLDSSTPDYDRYRVWVLRGPGSYQGAFTPDTLSMQLLLEETIIDLGPLGIVGWTVEQTAQVDFTATSIVPEPSTALLVGLGLVGFGCLRRHR